MATPNQKLAASLKELRSLQKNGARVFRSSELTRTSRERLLKHGFLSEAVKGWLFSTDPGQTGATTPWFTSFWEFCRRYCDTRFGGEWSLSPEQSLLFHGENTSIPAQVIVWSPRAHNSNINLPFETSLFGLLQRTMPPAGDLMVRNGLRLLGVEAALCKVPPSFFKQHPVEARIALGSVGDPSGLLGRMLGGGHTVIAGRLAGALRRIGNAAAADEIISAMRAADYAVREVDPFDEEEAVHVVPPPAPAIVARLRLLWASMRGSVLLEMPPPPGLPSRHEAYLKHVDGIYQLDAYHSLSIEGYHVTDELIARVATGGWDPDGSDRDRATADALAARGYWLAFKRVQTTLREILSSGGKIGILRTAHRQWYREMFQPHVAAGLTSAAMLAGYRGQPVYLRDSRHVPPRWEVLRDAMPALFDLIEQETEPGVRAVLGHWLFGYVHPFPDGNGRIARFLMNTLLASGGYAWTVIRREERAQYLTALEAASAGNDVTPFAKFIARQIAWANTARGQGRTGRRTRRTDDRAHPRLTAPRKRRLR